MPNTPSQMQSVSYQKNDNYQNSAQTSSYPPLNVTRNIANNAGQNSTPTTPSGLTVGVGKQTQQSNPNGNNGGNNNGEA